MDNQNRRNFFKTSAILSMGAVGGIASVAADTKINSDVRDSKKAIPNFEKRVLGSGVAALEVSAFGLGCMGMSYHRSFVAEKQKMIEMIHAAVDLGVTLFDTAEAYGPLTNERLVGEALQQVRKDVKIATKFGFIDGQPNRGLDSRPKTIRKVVEQSLKNLRTDYIDILYQHRVDKNVPIEDVAGTVKELIAEGKVKHFGMSEAGVDVIRKAHREQPLTALQSEFSLMTREPEHNVIPLCEELGIGFVPYSPLSRGFITGYINERTKYIASNDNRASLPRYEREAVIANWPLIDVLKSFGDYRGLTVAQVALAWLLAKKPFIVPIPGTTKLAHLKENLDASKFTFATEDLKELDLALSKVKIMGDRYTGTSAQQTDK
ncbi:aldo/keto reductase [Sphingobacterium deserti]|uniref:Aldo/keto reductase n=1 Tax=Sphingobacterium deserti TaxID=1229276 RepID=A0A0B8T681_9SPHI|nr:aldo/keto reductase [Sphingobacterium deserti]KGE12585.1 aldo/keto reductase [Sphingobacterium deserti]